MGWPSGPVQRAEVEALTHGVPCHKVGAGGWRVLEAPSILNKAQVPAEVLLQALLLSI